MLGIETSLWCTWFEKETAQISTGTLTFSSRDWWTHSGAPSGVSQGNVVCVINLCLWWDICCLFVEVVKYLFWYQLSTSMAKKFLSVLSELSTDALAVLDKAQLFPGMKAFSFWPIYTDNWQFQATNLPSFTTSLKQLYIMQSTNPEHSASPNGPIHSVPKNTHWPQT